MPLSDPTFCLVPVGLLMSFTVGLTMNGMPSPDCSSTASMLVRGHVAVVDFTDEAIADPAVLAVAGKVRYETPDYPTYPQAFPGGVRVTLTDGTTLERDFPYQKGGPENPMSEDEVREKFRANAALALSPDATDALETAILDLERRDDLTAALAPLTAAKEPVAA